MKKPVAELNIKIFSENGHYKTNTSVNLDPNNLDVFLATLEAIDDLGKKLINERAKAFIKNIFRGAITDDEIEKLMIKIERKEIERKECTR